MKTLFLILPATLFMASCASTSRRPEPVEHFVTHIADDGTKMFSYSITNSNPRQGNKKGGKGGGRHGGGGGPGRNSGGSKDRSGQPSNDLKMKEKFLRKLEETLFEQDYCHDGYSKIESFFDREMSQFRGQCEEKASDEDYDKFPNQ